MNWTLPTSVEVGGVARSIKTDYRAALDMCAALSDPNLSEDEKALVLLMVFYDEWETIRADDYQEAVDQCIWFLCGGEVEEPSPPAPKLMDWEQDFKLIVGPVNRVIGREIREPTPLHWWTFLSAYYEVGDCLFAQVVRIRDMKAKGKQLDKADKEWYRQNRAIVDFKVEYTDAEQELLAQFSKVGD